MRNSTFRGLATCFALCAAGPCLAQGRPDTTQMQCKAAAALVASRGAIVLSTGPSTYDRYVTGDGFCQPDEVTKPAYVKSADNPQCFIGYYCFQRNYEGNR